MANYKLALRALGAVHSSLVYDHIVGSLTELATGRDNEPQFNIKYGGWNAQHRIRYRLLFQCIRKSLFCEGLTYRREG